MPCCFEYVAPGFWALIKGYRVFQAEAEVLRWAQTACDVVRTIDTSERRHGRTWFVGVDALPNLPDGSIDGVPLKGTWLKALADVPAFDEWHRAQVSIVFPGYPKQDPDESDAAHQFRINRDAAHMDGLLPEGPQKRRHLREPHAFVVGIALNDVAASPLVVWEDSHKIMQAAFTEILNGEQAEAWGDLDVTDAYQAARREVFASCKRVEVVMRPGEVVLLDRHLIHGVAPWSGPDVPEGRQIAYFRPEVSRLQDWL